MTAIARADGDLTLCYAPFYPEQVLAHLILNKILYSSYSYYLHFAEEDIVVTLKYIHKLFKK